MYKHEARVLGEAPGKHLMARHPRPRRTHPTRQKAPTPPQGRKKKTKGVFCHPVNQPFEPGPRQFPPRGMIANCPSVTPRMD